MSILICFGTRPEYIKVKSLIENLTGVKTCMTGQHADLLKHVAVDISLTIPQTSPNRLNNVCIGVLQAGHIFDDVDSVIVQGDTTSALAIALSAVHHGKKVIHLEAGLRTHDTADPFPEELNRQLISRIASVHLCPTELNRENLRQEGILRNVHVVGNTGLDSIDRTGCSYGSTVFVTLHRRKNVECMSEWFRALDGAAEARPLLDFVIALHPNPEIRKHASVLKHVRIVEPLTHAETIKFVKTCRFVVSDSGGLQEETSFLNKRIVICRESTERPEILESNGILCPTPSDLERCIELVSANPRIDALCPYGDGAAYKKIIQILNC
jgi:UDP-N-acetylglucosamine 2-epimerase